MLTLEHEPVLSRQLLAEHLDRARDDPLVDRPDQVVALGDGKERVRRDQLAERVAHAQKQLVLADLPRRQVKRSAGPGARAAPRRARL
jgi:hypothetical protein